MSEYRAGPRGFVRRPLLTLSATVSAALLLAAGCKVDQKAEVARYRDVLNQNVATTSPVYDPERPLSLVDAMELANANNEQLARSGEDYVQALIDKNRAVAAFLPTLTFQPSFTVEEAPRGTQSSGISPGSGGGATPGSGGATGTGNGTGTVVAGSSGFRRLTGGTLRRLEAPVVGSINLFRAGADVYNVRAAEANIEARRQLLLDVQAATMLSVAESYYAVLRAERSVAVLRNSLTLQEARLDFVRGQFNNGLATRLTVEQTRAQLDGTRATLAQAEGDVANARSTLALIIGVPVVDTRLLDNFQTPTTLPTADDLETRAARFRFDIAAAVATLDVARSSVNVAFAQYYPSVSLNISGFLYREFFSDASRWNAILSANLPIFSGGLIQADVRAAWSRLRQAALDESYTRRRAISEVKQAAENFRTADRRIFALDDEVAAAQESLRQSTSALTNGLAVNLDVLTAQDQLLTSQLDLAGAAFDRTIFYLDLLRATGELSDKSLAETITEQAGPTTALGDPAP